MEVDKKDFVDIRFMFNKIDNSIYAMEQEYNLRISYIKNLLADLGKLLDTQFIKEELKDGD